jgi:hypothetical protein
LHQLQGSNDEIKKNMHKIKSIHDTQKIIINTLSIHEETSTVVASMDGVDGNSGGGGWQMATSNTDGLWKRWCG